MYYDMFNRHSLTLYSSIWFTETYKKYKALILVHIEYAHLFY